MAAKDGEDKRLETVKEELEGRRTEILRELRAVSDGAERETGGDEGDRASASVSADITFETRARESRNLQRIEDALKKIDNGTYGGCTECDEPIAAARLAALPFATLCIDCQEKLEESGALDGPRAPRNFGMVT